MTKITRSSSDSALSSILNPDEITKATLLHGYRSVKQVENTNPNLSRSGSIQELPQHEKTQGFKPSDSEELGSSADVVRESSLLTTDDDEPVQAFEFNEDNLRKTLDSLCNSEDSFLKFLEPDGKSENQRIEEYKQLKKDIDNGIKFHSEIPGLPDIEELKHYKKAVTIAAITAGLEKPTLAAVNKFFSNKDNVLALAAALSGLAVSLPMLITGIVASANAVEGEVEKTDEMLEAEQQIANNEQELDKNKQELDKNKQELDTIEQTISKLKNEFIPKGLQGKAKENERFKAEQSKEKELFANEDNRIYTVIGGNIIETDLKEEFKIKAKEAGDDAADAFQKQQDDIQTEIAAKESKLKTVKSEIMAAESKITAAESKINEAELKIAASKGELAGRTDAASRQSSHSINSGAVLGIGVAMMAGSLIAGGATKYYRLKRNSQGKINSDLAESHKSRLTEDYNKVTEMLKEGKEIIKKARAEEKRIKKEEKTNAKRSRREELAKNAQNIFSISHRERQALKSIPEDSGITEVPNSSNPKIDDQPMSDQSTSKESDITKN